MLTLWLTAGLLAGQPEASEAGISVVQAVKRQEKAPLKHTDVYWPLRPKPVEAPEPQPVEDEGKPQEAKRPSPTFIGPLALLDTSAAELARARAIAKARAEAERLEREAAEAIELEMAAVALLLAA